MEQSNIPSNPAQITKDLVKASFNIELTRLNYQRVLQSTMDIVWTRENIKEDLLAPAKTVAAKLTEKKEIIKRPVIDKGKIIQDEYNSVFNPINNAISLKAEEKKKLALQIQKEEDEARAAAEKIARINQSIVMFIQNTTNEITEADNDSQIVLIEKKIGSELSRKSFYENDFINVLKRQCEELKPLIKKQKEYIRVLDTLNKGTYDAMAKGDESKAVELRTQAEEMKEVIDENRLRLQAKAFEQIENSDVVVGIPIDTAPDATRTTWKWKVDNVQLLFKKKPELIDLVPNKDLIDSILKGMKEAGALKGKREESWFGITFYQDKSYK